MAQVRRRNGLKFRALRFVAVLKTGDSAPTSGEAVLGGSSQPQGAIRAPVRGVCRRSASSNCHWTSRFAAEGILAFILADFSRLVWFPFQGDWQPVGGR